MFVDYLVLNCQILTTKIGIKFWNTIKIAQDSSLFRYILTVESDSQAQFATNRSNHTALTALIRQPFLLRYSPQTKLPRSIPIHELVCTAIGATKRSVVFCTT